MCTIEDIRKLFDRYSAIYGQLWSSRHKDSEAWKDTLYVWYNALKNYDLVVLRETFEISLVMYRDYAPTLPQILSICMSKSGIPDVEQIILDVSRRTSSHSVSSIIMKKIGKYDLQHMTKTELRKRVSELHADAVNDHLLNNEQVKRIPSPINCTHQEIESDENKKLIKNHPKWPDNAVNVHHKHFDEKLYEERRKYLCDLSEESSSYLNKIDRYDRCRFKAQQHALKAIRFSGNTLG